MPEGLWYKTPTGRMVLKTVLRDHAHVSPEDGYHIHIGPTVYFDLLFDDKQCTELATHLTAADPLHFVDNRPYTQWLQQAQAQTNHTEAIQVAHGHVNGIPLIVGCMDFGFIGGSMGAVVGEKIARAADYAIQHNTPLLLITASGGARMMEAGFSLMQMAKTAAKLQKMAEANIPYMTLLTNPMMGGVSASFAMLGDIIMAEPDAMIGFAGPRVIWDTIGKELPPGFQHAELLLAQGFLDCIVDRRHLKQQVTHIVTMLTH